MGFDNFFRRDFASYYLYSFLATLTFFFALSAAWNLYQNDQNAIQNARTEIKTILDQNLEYTRWNTLLGGVYGRITAENQPNPYLIVEDKDLQTVEGIPLTMINHYQMTQQANELLKVRDPETAPINRTVSLKALNPENVPDPWEKSALIAVENGASEVSEIVDINGREYMRLLKPYITEPGCLKCHGRQGYRVGDVRGGLSIAIPMAPHFAALSSGRNIIIFTHLVLWLCGVLTILIFFRKFQNYQNDLAESEKKFRIVSEGAYNFESWINQDNTIAYISPSCERITGYTPEEFYQNPRLLLDIVHPEDRDTFRHHLSNIKSPAHEDLEVRIIAKDGQIRWMSHTCSPVYHQGKFLGRRGSNREITDKKRLEQQLLLAQKMESLGHFAGGIAHDFNNTLSSITTFTHLLDDEVLEHEKTAKEYLKYINIAAKLGKNLASNLLTFARKQDIILGTTSLNSIIRNIADIIRTLITEDISLALTLNDDEATILADSHQIEQVVINLCTNSRDSMVDGGRLEIKTRRITFSSDHVGKFGLIPAGGYMELSVSDTGNGIRKSDISSIFEPLYTTKKKGQGTGLGLYIVNNIISQHNGFIDIDSEVGRGTTFRIYFREYLHSAAPEEAAAARPAGEGGRAAGKTVLLAEDEEMVRDSLGMLLEHEGYHVITAADGEEALERYMHHRPAIALVILDVVLPKKNGREIYNFIKADDELIKFLFMSGYTNDIINQKGITEEGLEFLPKPLDINEFIAKVHALLQD